jgi:hypothetical protein
MLPSEGIDKREVDQEWVTSETLDTLGNLLANHIRLEERSLPPH